MKTGVSTTPCGVCSTPALAFVVVDSDNTLKLNIFDENHLRFKFDRLVKSHFANDIEQFWKKIQNEPGVKNFKLFEGVSPSF